MQWDAFSEVCAVVDYLLKPFDEKTLSDYFFGACTPTARCGWGVAQRQVALTEVLDQLERSAKSLREPPARIIAEAGGRMYVFDAGRVEMIEADRNYVRLTVGRDAYSTRSTLQHAEWRL